MNHNTRNSKVVDPDDFAFHGLRSLAATALVATRTYVNARQKRRRLYSSVETAIDKYARATTEAENEAENIFGACLLPFWAATK